MFALERCAVEVDLSVGPADGTTLVGAKARGPEADLPTAPARDRFVALLRQALAGAAGA
jgi:inosine-uridine nucleoside N-ribohydrolase